MVVTSKNRNIITIRNESLVAMFDISPPPELHLLLGIVNKLKVNHSSYCEGSLQGTIVGNYVK